MATSQSIKEKCKQFVEKQAKEVEAVQRENVSRSLVYFVHLLCSVKLILFDAMWYIGLKQIFGA